MRNRYDKREAKIYPAARNKWRVKFFDAKAKRYRFKQCSTKTDAENLRRALNNSGNLSYWFPSQENPKSVAKTFSDIAADWMDHAKYIREISDSCLRNYRCHLQNHILPVFGSKDCRDLKVSDIEGLAKILKNKKPRSNPYKALKKASLAKKSWDDELFEDDEFLSTSYRREILTVAVMITRWASASDRRLITENPFDTYVLPKPAEADYDYWSPENEDTFLDWIEAGGFYEHETTRYRKSGSAKKVIKLQVRHPQELRDIVLFALRTGMRLGEIGALRNMDVDLTQGFVLVRRSYKFKSGKFGPTKNKKSRKIEINGDVREILERRKHKPQSDLIFNIKINTIKFFSRTCRQAGVKEIHFHSLRHTCLTNLANGIRMEKHLSPFQVQQIAGHSDVKTTMRYVHNDKVANTGSLQWSRAKVRAEQTAEIRKTEGLRLVVCSDKN